MTAILAGRRGKVPGRVSGRAPLVVAALSALLATACSHPEVSNQAAAIEASQNGDQKTAISLTEKDVAHFSAPDQCSPSTNYNCGTLALTYGSLALYQIMSGDTAAGERSFRSAKKTLVMVNPENKASATGMVYRDVSEAYWKTGDKARAIAVFNEGRAAGGDSFLFTAAAAAAAKAAETKAAETAPQMGPEMGPGPATEPGTAPKTGPGTAPEKVTAKTSEKTAAK